MTTVAQKKAAKRAARPIYATVQRVAVMGTGEERLAILAMNPIDRRLMKERGYRNGDELRIEIKQPRNPGFHRLFHAIGHLMVDNVEDFRDLTAHDAIKRLQRESGVCCEEIEMDLGPMIGKVPVKVPRSMAFDEMAEDEAKVLFEGITAHIGANYAQVMLDDVRAEFWLMVEGDQR